MTQATLVFQLPAAQQTALRRRLDEGHFEFRSVPHARFSVKGEGVVATLYESGKLVVQGRGAEMFAGRFLEAAAAPTKATRSSPARAADATLDADLIGSDECGKGDYFGPLLVCAVRVTPELARNLAQGRVADSKVLTDRTALTLGAALRAHVPHAIARLDPPEYNAAHAERGNVNELLADLHAQAIRELYQPGIDVLVDRFAAENLIRSRLKDLDVRLEQRFRAESNIAVAAASVIAREQFLTALSELSTESAVDLHKGAGEPVDSSGVEYALLHGVDALGRVAKLHFKNTLKIRQRLEDSP